MLLPNLLTSLLSCVSDPLPVSLTWISKPSDSLTSLPCLNGFFFSAIFLTTTLYSNLKYRLFVFLD